MDFLIALILIAIFIFEKLYFIYLEPVYSKSFVALIDIILYFSFIFLGIRNYLLISKSYKKRQITKKYPLNIVGKLSLFLFLLAVLFSIYLNYTKLALDWDSVALYEARAKFLLSGMKFSEMLNLSKYDNLNSYYYLLYPPYTSLTHFFWHKLIPYINVGMLYSVYLFLLGIGIFVTTKRYINQNLAALLTLLITTNREIYKVSLVEYTNLPFSLYIVLGTFLLYGYLNDREEWKLYFATILIASSQWIRQLEPIWLIVMTSFFVALFLEEKLKRALKISFPLFIIGVVQYFSWNFFVNNVSFGQGIFKFTASGFFESIFGLFSGVFVRVFIYFVISWGSVVIIHLASVFVFEKDEIKSKKFSGLFLKLVIILSILYYFTGMYFLSFQVSWWKEMGSSMVRSSSFLIPMSGFLLFKYVDKLLLFNKLFNPNNKFKHTSTIKQFISKYIFK